VTGPLASAGGANRSGAADALAPVRLSIAIAILLRWEYPRFPIWRESPVRPMMRFGPLGRAWSGSSEQRTTAA